MKKVNKRLKGSTHKINWNLAPVPERPISANPWLFFHFVFTFQSLLREDDSPRFVEVPLLDIIILTWAVSSSVTGRADTLVLSDSCVLTSGTIFARVVASTRGTYSFRVNEWKTLFFALYEEFNNKVSDFSGDDCSRAS